MKDDIKAPIIKNKAGPWSRQEKDYIAKYAETKLPSQIAKDLRRNEEAIIKYMQANNMVSSSKKLGSDAKVEHNIKDTPHWEELKKQFSKEELESFLYHWNNTIKQFRDDVLHTEELQIIDMIKLELLMNRLLTQETLIKANIEQLKSDLEDIKRIPADSRSPDDKNDMYELDRQIANLYVSIGSINKEYRENLKEKIKILDKLKATREQRIKEIQSGKETMAGWIRQLLLSPQLLNRLGSDMEKMRLATLVEYDRLSDYHTYVDGMVDQPLLTPETVFKVEELPDKEDIDKEE